MILRGKGLGLSRGLAVAVLAMSVFFLFGSLSATAAGNPELSFQGKIVTSAGINVPDGSYNMEFKIYTGCTNEPTSSAGCTAVWTEDWLVGGTLPDQPMALTSGTFQANLGSICAFSGGSCEGNTNTAINWDTNPLYLSMQIGSSSTCSTLPPAGAFQADCGGDSVMDPFIELTSTPYAQDSNELNGLTSAAFGQLADASAETWSGNTNKFQPATLNVPSLLVDQNNSGAFGQDIFDVQGSSGGTNNFIQVTSTAANAGAININALGGTTNGNNVTITGGTATAANIGGTVALVGGSASATAGSDGGAITLTGANGTGTGTGGDGGNITLLSGSAAGNATVAQNAGTISIDTGTAVDGGTAILNIGTTNAAAITLGNTTATTVTQLKGAGASELLNSSGATFATATNSQTAFQIQNAVGSPIFQVDTTSTDATGATVNYLTYPGFEVPNGALPQGWTVVGSGTLTQNTNQQFVYNGIDSAKLVATASGAGLTTSSFTSTPPIQAYIVSFYVEPAVGTTINPSQFTVSMTGTSTTTCSPAGTTTLSTAGFTQLFCTVAATSAAPTAMKITETAGAGTVYFDGIQMQSTTYDGTAITAPSGYQIGGLQLRGIIENPVDIEPQTNSTTAFQVQNSAGSDIFFIDNLNDIIQVGSSTANTNPILLGLNNYSNFTDPASTCTATTNNGALYYNTNTDNVRACISGTWQDLVSTAGLSQLLFGVVPNSGNNPGDLIGASATATTNTGGPCKVVWASTTSVSVNSCLAYSGGREVEVPRTTIALGTIAKSDFENICLNSSGVPVLMGGVSGTDGAQTSGNLSSSSATSLGQPLLCLATIKASAATANDIGLIYDIRTFTTTSKTYGTMTSATQILGGVVTPTGAGAGLVEITTATTNAVVGVIVAATGTAGTAGTPNIMYATAGPQWVKATGATNGDFVDPTATGYTTAANNNGLIAFDQLGIAQAGTYETSCTSAAFGATDCQASDFTFLQIQ